MQKAAENAAQAASEDARGVLARDRICPCFVLYLF
jgi:hypothetical protein